MLNSSSLITVEEARRLQQNWIETRADAIEKEMGAEDGREFLFSLDELQKFLDYIKEKSKSKNPGIRIYLAAYNENNKKGATLFLAPTDGTSLDSSNDYTLKPLNRVMQGWPPLNY